MVISCFFRVVFVSLLVIGLVSILAESRREVKILSQALLSASGALIQADDVLLSYYIQPIAIKHFNERYSGIISEIASVKASCNVELKLVGGTIHDNGGETDAAMLGFVNAFSANDVDVVHGPARSEVASSIGVTAGALKIPIVSHLVTADAMSDKRVFPTFFRVIPSSSQYALVLTQLFIHYKYKKVGILYVNNDYGNAIKNALYELCRQRSITLITSLFEDGPVGAVDLEARLQVALNRLKDERVNVIYYTPGGAHFLSSLANVAHTLNWIKGKLYIHQINLVREAVQAAPNQAIIREFFHGSFNVFYAVNEANRAWKNLLNAWSSFNVSDVNPSLPNGTTGKGQSYKLEDDYFLKRAALKASYRYVSVGYDSVIAIGLAACGGSSGGLLDNLKRVAFQGTSGQIRFDANQDRDRNTFRAYIDNIVVSGPRLIDINAVRVGILEQDEWNETSNTPVFSDGTNVPPLDYEHPFHDVERLPFAAQMFGWVAGSMATVLSVASLVYILFHRGKMLADGVSLYILCLLSCGCLLLAGSMFALTFEDHAACMAFPWLFSLGFTLALTSLCAKSRLRIALLRRRRQRRALECSNNTTVAGGNDGDANTTTTMREQTISTCRLPIVLGTCTVILINFAIMVLWQTMAPLEFTIVTFRRDTEGSPLLSSAVCIPANNESTAFLAVFVTYLCCLIFLTLGITLYARNDPDRYQEAQMMVFAAACTFQAFFVGIPAAAAVWNSPLPRFLVLSSITFVICMIILVPLILPRIVNWRLFTTHHSNFRTLAAAQDAAIHQPSSSVSTLRRLHVSSQFRTTAVAGGILHSTNPGGHTAISNDTATGRVFFEDDEDKPISADPALLLLEFEVPYVPFTVRSSSPPAPVRHRYQVELENIKDMDGNTIVLQ